MPEPTVLDVLRAARERISVPERWTQGADARDAQGDYCPPRDPRAVAWCGLGVLHAECLPGEVWTSAWKALRAGAEAFGVSAFNDAPERTHAEVIALFDRAIAAEEARV